MGRFCLNRRHSPARRPDTILSVLSILPAAAAAQAPVWPALPSQEFIRGRPATKADVAAGNAVFVAAIGEKVIGRALEMPIPQYAYFNDRGRKIQVVVVQAEELRSWVLVLWMARRSSASFPILSCLAMRDQRGRLANFRMQPTALRATRDTERYAALVTVERVRLT
jgi:hypothetical protein